MGVGKTSVCRELKRLRAPCLFLDGDWCWDMEPFLVNAQTKALVLENIVFQLNNALACPAFRDVLFCWVLHEDSIVRTILGGLKGDYRLFRFTLTARDETLTARLTADIGSGLRTPDVIGRSLERSRAFETAGSVEISTDGLSCREIAQEIAARIGRESAGRPAAQEGERDEQIQRADQEFR